MMSSLYTGASGLKTQGEGMSVISNNISNINTVGFKQVSMQYADLMSQYMTSSAGNATNISQKGLGATVDSTRTLFTQGGLEAASASTDLLISGKGFFGVTNNGKTHYTRAGNFRFNKDGELLDASGWNVLGRPIVNGAEGATQPITLDMSENGMGYLPPQSTSRVTSSSNLGGLEDVSPNADNPFFSMASSWDGTASPPLPNGSYSYSEAVQFYDSNGELQNATIYYDAAGKSGGSSATEYLLAMDPSRDGSAQAGTSAAGLLMAGTLTFGSNGQLTNMTAFTPPASGTPADLGGWTPAALKDGQPVFTVQPAGAAEQAITLDMGFVLGPDASSSAGLASAAEAAANPQAIYSTSAGSSRKEYCSVAMGEAPSGLRASRDGYAGGTLRDVQVSSDGVISGVYSNNQTQELYRISMYRFTSEDGLRHEGSNHFSATMESGAAEEGIAGEENFGTLTANALEQSNVDYAREFSLLIVTQRGFQMNSKVVTTTDTMLQKALELKR